MQQQIQIYINDEIVDIHPDEDPVLTFQINELASTDSINGNVTNVFALADTQRNRAILGFPDDITIDSLAPYRFYPAKVVVAGVEVIPLGQAEIQNFDNDKFNMLITSGNIDFFDAINFQIRDMGDSTSAATNYGLTLPWQDYDHVWSVDSMVDSQTKTDGWIWPIVSYGGVPDNPPFTDPGQLINVRNQRPAFFLHTFVEILAKAANYRIDYERSSLMRDPLYQKLLIPFSASSFEHGTDYQNQIPEGGFETTLGVAKQVSPGGPSSGNIQFNPVPLVPDGINYTASGNITGKVTLIFDFYMYGYIYGNSPSQVTIGINARNPYPDTGNTNVGSQVLSFGSYGQPTLVDGTSGSTREAYQTFHNVKIMVDAPLANGMQLNINFSTQHSGVTYWKMLAGATWTFEPDEVGVLFGQMIQCERILPDIGQKDLLKCIFQKFATVCQTDNINRKITFASFTDIVQNIPNALDWSDKLVDNGRQLYYQLDGFTRINWLRYQQDSSIPVANMPRFFADDRIIVDDQTLSPANPQQDLFTSIFAPTLNQPYIGGSIARLSDPNSTESFSAPDSPRLLVDQKYVLRSAADGSGEKVVFSDADSGYETYTRQLTGGQVISVPYFYKPDGEFNLCFCDKGNQPGLRTKYYGPVEKMLKQYKKLVLFFVLTPYDIASLDLLVPIYVRHYNAYFYISKIDSWKHGQACKVEVVKL